MVLPIVKVACGALATLVVSTTAGGVVWGWPGAAIGFGVATVVVIGGLLVWNPSLRYLSTGMRGTGVGRECGDRTPNWTALEGQAQSAGRAHGTVRSGPYYAEYHGHRVEHLVAVRQALVQRNPRTRFVYFIGDSTLDNKHWFFGGFRTKESQMNEAAFTAPAVNGYEHVLVRPARMVQDVSYWMNMEAERRLGAGVLTTLMTSVEESTVQDRAKQLLVQDQFVQHYVTERDVLVVSMGGNDVALHPTLQTAVAMALLLRSPNWMINCGCAPGLGYFVRLFSNRISNIVKRIVSRRRPALVVACMLYYLDEQPGGSWADVTLSALGYDSNPAKLQLVMRAIYKRVKAKDLTAMTGAPTVTLPMFDVLDGKTSADYEQRVEPSVSGGHKLAAAFLDTIVAHPQLQHQLQYNDASHNDGASRHPTRTVDESKPLVS